jgi:hypothetical protein
VLITNHPHLLVTPRHEDSLPRTMQALGQRDVRHVNTANGRIGTLWEGRYRAAPIDSEAYFLACCPYIELNPVRAGMVAHPRVTHGRATARARWRPPTPWSPTIRSISSLVARRPTAGHTGHCLGHLSMRLSLMRCAPPPTANGRSAMRALSGKCDGAHPARRALPKGRRRNATADARQKIHSDPNSS